MNHSLHSKYDISEPQGSIPLQRKKDFCVLFLCLERAMGIGPTQPAWEAGTLPLSYARIYIISVTYYATFVNQMHA